MNVQSKKPKGKEGRRKKKGREENLTAKQRKQEENTSTDT